MRLTMRVSAVLLAAALVPAGVILIGGEALFTLVFGKTWAGAGWIAQLLTPWGVAALVMGPLSRIVLVLEGQEYKLVYDVLALVLTVTVFSVGAAYQLDAHTVVAALSAVQVASYAVFLGAILWLCRRAARQS